MDMNAAYAIASDIARQARALPGVSDVLVPQDVDYPALKIDIDRERASELGLSAKDVADSLITALTSNGMIAPSYWIDPKNGQQLSADRAVSGKPGQEPRRPRLDAVAGDASQATDAAGFGGPFLAHPRPTEVDHYQIQRTVDVYVAPRGRGPEPGSMPACKKIVDRTRTCRKT